MFHNVWEWTERVAETESQRRWQCCERHRLSLNPQLKACVSVSLLEWGVNCEEQSDSQRQMNIDELKILLSVSNYQNNKLWEFLAVSGSQRNNVCIQVNFINFCILHEVIPWLSQSNARHTTGWWLLIAFLKSCRARVYILFRNTESFMVSVKVSCVKFS